LLSVGSKVLDAIKGVIWCVCTKCLTMNDKDQKIIHRWDYGFGKPTWTTQSSKNISKVLD
jgi:hypothetical protein